MLKTKNSQRHIAVILLDIRSIENVGAIIRTADGAGVDTVYLVGITPGPIDRFGREVKAFTKASLGAEKAVKIETTKNISSLIKKLKKDKFEIIALEQDKKSVDYKKIKPKNNFAIILGNEVNGIPKNVFKSVDKIIEIKMKGKKESLNVSVAFGITIFSLTD
ncbi:MAG: TrmH family RNA methyltransferase [Minisyncoccia bacterium]